MSEPTFEDYLHLLATAPKPEIRANAAWRLGRTRHPSVVLPLVKAATDESALVRTRVMEALGGLRDGVIIAPLASALRDEDADVRVMAARSLGAIANMQALEPLLATLNDPNSEVRSEVAQALGAVPSDQASAPLAHILIADDDPTVRHFAKQSLGRIGGDSVIDVLLPELETYKDNAGILIDLIEVLTHIYARRALPAIQQFTQHPDTDVQATVAWACNLLTKANPASGRHS
jgi:HEAT repeat protein